MLVHYCMCVTCSEVIPQQAADPFCEDTGSEQVVAAVIHCELGFHLRVKINGETACYPVTNMRNIVQ